MLNIVIFGAPGSGKGTQGEMIAKRYNLEHVSTGELLRNEIKNATELGKSANEYISKGQLVPDAIVIGMIEELIKTTTGVDGFLFDGFPRTLTQGVELDKKLEENNMSISKVLRLDVEENELIERLLNRGKLEGRADDNRETIESRLDVYHNQTQPLIDFYNKQSKMTVIEGSGDINAIFQSIVEVMDNHL
ncbi:MAG: adenylate kinase [Proteiniphilum sp.]|nr:adenylate kinase [Proteiniphilum sp.]